MISNSLWLSMWLGDFGVCDTILLSKYMLVGGGFCYQNDVGAEEWWKGFVQTGLLSWNVDSEINDLNIC